MLFGDVGEHPGLSKRDRSLVMVSALIAMNRPDQLRAHMVRARENGVTQDELIESITHLAFYAGWPSAVTANEGPSRANGLSETLTGQVGRACSNSCGCRPDALTQRSQDTIWSLLNAARPSGVDDWPIIPMRRK